jgi:hypothetical protein
MDKNSLVHYAIELLRKRIRLAIGRIPRPYPELSRLLRFFDAKRNPPDILYLSDSVTERVSQVDRDRRTLDQFVSAKLSGEKSLACIAHYSYHPAVYYHLLQVLKTTRHKPEVVILPVNMRCFSPQWDREPSWQFSREIGILERYASGADKSIPWIGDVIEKQELYEQFDAEATNFPLTYLNTVGQFRLTISGKPSSNEQRAYRYRQIFIFHYMYPLDGAHPKVKYLEQTIKLLNDLGVSVLVYNTPVNVQAGRKYVGPEFEKSLQANIDVIAKAIRPHLKDRSLFLDLASFLTSECFFHMDDPTEHLNQAGRNTLAEKLAQQLLDLS